ncbi:hypothetical protein [Micromonospora sp. NPDC006431]|uniref:hypothetical protein n=1 Tax=Micromonospora sp. NPDC006431 TaxID=3364235 RepID=UPI00368064C8
MPDVLPGPCPGGGEPAMLVFRVNAAAVRAIMAADPNHTTPGVTVVPLRPWRPVVGTG